MESYITLGVVAGAALLFFAGLAWFLLLDEQRMQREDIEEAKHQWQLAKQRRR